MYYFVFWAGIQIRGVDSHYWVTGFRGFETTYCCHLEGSKGRRRKPKIFNKDKLMTDLF